MWFRDGFQQEYIVTYKHLYIKGLSGYIYILIRYFLIGFLGTWCTVFYLKEKGHDSMNNFRAVAIKAPGSELYDNYCNMLKPHADIRKWGQENAEQDFLGRSN